MNLPEQQPTGLRGMVKDARSWLTERRLTQPTYVVQLALIYIVLPAIFMSPVITGVWSWIAGAMFDTSQPVWWHMSMIPYMLLVMTLLQLGKWLMSAQARSPISAIVFGFGLYMMSLMSVSTYGYWANLPITMSALDVAGELYLLLALLYCVIGFVNACLETSARMFRAYPVYRMHPHGPFGPVVTYEPMVRRGG